MSRLADVAKAERFPLPGPCQCAGAVHPDGDWILVRTELGIDDASAVLELSPAEALADLALEWNLLDDDGRAIELTRDNVGKLFTDDIAAFFSLEGEGDKAQLTGWFSEHVRLVTAPNASGGRSGTGTPATALPNRAARRSRRSSTP